jgi:hypothetical protein
VISVVASGAVSRAYATPIAIIPTFGTSITNDPNAASIESVIDTAISFYTSNITTPTTDQVNITFNEMTSGLGQSTTNYVQVSYSSYLNSLMTTSSGNSTDITALAHLPSVASYTATYGTSNIMVATALARGLGYGVPLGTDSTIGLNTSITNIAGGPYSLLAVTEHEIDEALGLGSDVGGTGFFSQPRPEDLYRYDASGNRSFTTDPTALAYFSLNGSTDLAQFDNQNDGGDFGDWQSNPLPPGVSPRVQDAFATPDSDPFLTLGSPEAIALDAIGYNVNTAVTATPLPAALPLFATGLGAFGLLGWRRKRKARVSLLGAA